MLKKSLVVLFFSAASIAMAEPQRSALSTENKFPELGQLELGYEFTTREFDNLNYRSHELVARYGLIEHLTARLHAPYNINDPDFGDKEEGLGDVRLGFDLVAYQDVFSYPYVIPYLNIGFSTGDEDKGLGSGESMYQFGVSLGTKTFEKFNWVLDISFAENYDVKASDPDNVLEVGLAWIWELSDRFAISVEGLVQDFQDTDNEPYLIGGGFSYMWTEQFQTRFFFGGWQEQESGEDQVINVNAAYTF